MIKTRMKKKTIIKNEWTNFIVKVNKVRRKELTKFIVKQNLEIQLIQCTKKFQNNISYLNKTLKKRLKFTLLKNCDKIEKIQQSKKNEICNKKFVVRKKNDRKNNWMQFVVRN